MNIIGKKKLSIILLILTVIELGSLFLMYKSLNNKNIVLDNISLKEEVDNDIFAILLEQEDGTYEVVDSKTWPVDYDFNALKSGCLDTNGIKLDGVLTYDSIQNIATIESGKTSQCYLYFDIKPTGPLDFICKNYVSDEECIASESIWESTLEDDGYRYVGTNPSNYICFGTTSKTDCVANTDKYMYRIIGIFEDEDEKQHLKLIKKEALNTAYTWNSSNSTDAAWGANALFNGINGSYFLTNTAYNYMQDSNWTNKIFNWKYLAVNTLVDQASYGLHYNHNKSKVVYLHEMNKAGSINETCYRNSSGTTAGCTAGIWTTVSSQKIGLMYVSDYLLSLGSSSLNYVGNSNSDALKTGWIHISNSDSGSPSIVEWTMSRSGLYSGIQTAFSIYSAGTISGSYVTNSYSARPVFYLNTDVAISGEGTSSDPYIIE